MIEYKKIRIKKKENVKKKKKSGVISWKEQPTSLSNYSDNSH
jgi:hypothetical protein